MQNNFVDELNTVLHFNIETHNLVRARAQIALLKDMEKKLCDMRLIVKKCRESV